MLLLQVKIWFQNRRMKWKKDHKLPNVKSRASSSNLSSSQAAINSTPSPESIKLHQFSPQQTINDNDSTFDTATSPSYLSPPKTPIKTTNGGYDYLSQSAFATSVSAAVQSSAELVGGGQHTVLT